jgi:hypothetical protein
MVSFKRAHFEKGSILTCVRWYVAYPLSYRHLEEMMQERGVAVDHSTIHRWVLKYAPQLTRNAEDPGSRGQVCNVVGSTQWRSSRIKSSGYCSDSSSTTASMASKVFCRCRCGERLSGGYWSSGIGMDNNAAKSGTVSATDR